MAQSLDLEPRGAVVEGVRRSARELNQSNGLEREVLRSGDDIKVDTSLEPKSFQVRYRYRETVYQITVLQTFIVDGGPGLTVDGLELPGPAIPMVDDRRRHVVEVKIHGAARPQHGDHGH